MVGKGGGSEADDQGIVLQFSVFSLVYKISQSVHHRGTQHFAKGPTPPPRDAGSQKGLQTGVGITRNQQRKYKREY